VILDLYPKDGNEHAISVNWKDTSLPYIVVFNGRFYVQRRIDDVPSYDESVAFFIPESDRVRKSA